MGFSRQEYWTELPCPPPGDLPNLGMEPVSPALQAVSLPLEPQGKTSMECYSGKKEMSSKAMKRHRRILNAFKLKKPISKKYTLYDFKYTTVWKRQNYGNSKKISDFQHLEQKEG